MGPEYLHLEPAPDDATGAAPRVHVWLNMFPCWFFNDIVRCGMFGPAFIAWYPRRVCASEDDELRWFENAINRYLPLHEKHAQVVLCTGQLSALRPSARRLLRQFIREADAPGVPWPPVERRRVHVVMDGTLAELEALLGEEGTASETR